MRSLFQAIQRFFAQPAVREFLWWCLPAFLAAIVVRVVLMVQLPYAIYHVDSSDVLVTADRWVHAHKWMIHGKKTFLVPVIYTALALLRIPLLLTIPVVQHLAGVLMVPLVGMICRLWFTRWRWFIIPLTLIIALDPALLWFEHLIMPETAYVFCLTLTAVAGTLYALEQNWTRFAFLCLSLFVLAASRPEGKLLFGFAFLLILLLHGRRWRTDWVRVAILLVLAVTTHLVTRTGQAGLLLYTSVARFTPTELKSAPGFEPFIAPIRAEMQQRWENELNFPKVGDRRLVSSAVEDYWEKLHPGAKAITHEEANALCLQMATETCRKNFFKLPAYTYQKFRYATREAAYGAFDSHWVYDRQESAYVANERLAYSFSQGITGTSLKDEAEYSTFVHAHYQEVSWFNALASTWNYAVFATRFPDEHRVTPKGVVIRWQIPLLYLSAAAGLVLVMFRGGPLRRFHISWGLALLGAFYIVMLTANLRGRFRFGLEPFWYIYAALLLDCVVQWVSRLFRPAAARANPAIASSPVP